MTAPAWSDSTVKSTIASGPRRCLQNLLVIRLSLVPFAAVAAATIVIGIFDTAYAGSVDSGMDAALIGGGAALLFAVFVAVISVHLLSQHIKRVMSSVDSLSDEQLAMAASGTRETTRTLTQRLLRAIRPVEEIDRELVQRRRSQQLLERYFERDQLYAAVVRSANDAIITKTLEGRITAWNPAAEQLFGYKAEEVIGRSIDIIIPPERRGDLHHILERIGRGEYIEHFDTVRTTKDGRLLEVSLSISPVRSATGEIIGSAKVARDMTEQKRLRELVLHAQKMEAVGLMAGGVAHDFNNLLLVMMIHAEMMRNDCDPSDPQLPSIIEIVQSIQRARGLTRQLLAFSYKQPSEASALNVSAVVSGVHSMLRRLLPANIEIVTIVGDDIWSVHADKGQLEQVLINLALNARDAMMTGGRFGLEIENRALAEPVSGLAAGDYVALVVSDTGTGIPAEHLGRVFDPFFTTKERGRGTGLGLSMCYSIIAQAGGSLTVESTLGAGTSFLILLPRTMEVPSSSSETPISEEGARGQETILVVEDDNAVKRAAVAALQKSGYTVLTAANGDEARRLIDGSQHAIDMVLSDVVMPQLGGPELARYLANSRPDLRVLFMTGYSDYPVDSSDNRIENHRVIMKPFHPRELLTAIREVLDSTPWSLMQ
jgi:two-component system, cell cycle sensor histidine kinase and response regulator CckA